MPNPPDNVCCDVLPDLEEADVKGLILRLAELQSTELEVSC